MMELERALEVEDVVGRTLEGRAVTYGRTYRVSDDGGRTYYREAWQPGAFANSIRACRNLFELRRRHHDERLGSVSFNDSRRELQFRAYIDENEEGDDAIERIEAGDWRGVSLRFRPRRAEQPDGSGVIRRTQADIRELSIAATGQYEDAQVLAMRESPALTVIRAKLIANETILRNTLV